MLGRLIKHDIRATARMIPISFIAASVAFLTGLIASAINNSYLLGLSTFLLIISIFAVNIITFVVVVTRYYKNIFGNEGYLTGTLPVEKSKILASKAIVGIGWTLISYLFTGLCILGLVYLHNDMFMDESGFLVFGAVSLFDLIKMVFESKAVRTTVIYFVVTMIIQTILSIASIYCAITIAHTRPFIKHSVGFSIMWAFIINMITDTIDGILVLLIPFGLDTTTGHIVAESMLSRDGVVGLTALISDIIMSAVLFLLTNALLYKKTSVK